MRTTLSAIALSVLALACGAASAGPIPASYTFDQGTDSGSYVYNDPGYTKLTDGVVGYNGWYPNSAAPWVGWTDALVNIDFTFSGLTSISGVHVGSTQDNLNDVVLPSVTVSQWVAGNWVVAGSLVVPPSSANDNWYLDTQPHGFLDVTGLNIFSDKVRVTLSTNGPFMFTDEIKFDAGAQPAPNTQLPEPRTLGLMTAGLGLLAFSRRRQGAARRQ